MEILQKQLVEENIILMLHKIKRNDNNFHFLYHSILGNNMTTSDAPFSKRSIKELGIDCDEIDAAFSDDKNAVYIIKGSYFIKLMPGASIPLNHTLVFKDLYNCPDDLYSAFGDYTKFVEEFIKLDEHIDEHEQHEQHEHHLHDGTHNNDNDNDGIDNNKKDNDATHKKNDFEGRNEKKDDSKDENENEDLFIVVLVIIIMLLITTIIYCVLRKKKQEFEQEFGGKIQFLQLVKH